jgi:hypothetical protein
MPNYANVSGVPLSIAVFLATDNYDHEEGVISVTTLIKPIRQVILANRVGIEEAAVDLVNMTSSRMGTAIHDGIERAWLNNYKQALKNINLPDKVIERVLVNPTPDQLFEGCIPVYLERRSKKQVGKYLISGKFDFVGEGRLEDFKSTSVYSAMHDHNDEKYILQGSIYRWLNEDIITQDNMAIQFIFTDWSGARARTEANYPSQRIQEKVFPLKSITETHNYIVTKLGKLDFYWSKKEEELPECTDEELWRSAPVFKYYKNPEKTVRSTKNFDTKHDAMLKFIEDGSVGLVKEVPGQVTACKYCSGFSICTQKDKLIAMGDLVL